MNSIHLKHLELTHPDQISTNIQFLSLPIFFSEVVVLKQMTLAVFQILPVDPESNEFVALLSMHGLLVTVSTFSQNCVSEGLYNLVSQYMHQRE